MPETLWAHNKIAWLKGVSKIEEREKNWDNNNMFLQGFFAKQQANSAAKGVRDSIGSLGQTAGDKEKIARASARSDAAAELEKKKAERAERKAKLTEQMNKHRAGNR